MKIDISFAQCLNHVTEVWFSIYYLVRHEGGEGASDLMIVHVGLTGTQQDENKANGDGNLEHRLEEDCLIQPDEGHGRLLQKLNTT